MRRDQKPAVKIAAEVRDWARESLSQAGALPPIIVSNPLLWEFHVHVLLPVAPYIGLAIVLNASGVMPARLAPTVGWFERHGYLVKVADSFEDCRSVVEDYVAGRYTPTTPTPNEVAAHA